MVGIKINLLTRLVMVNRGDVRYQIKYEVLSLKDKKHDNSTG